IDVLFVNAAVSRFSPISMVDEPFFDTLFNINTKGAYFVTKYAAEIMPDGGSIILTSSVSGVIGVEGQSGTICVWRHQSGSALVWTQLCQRTRATWYTC
ncbi:MAG: SDR family oxidoreductase, partial [Methylocella sp.]